MSYIGHIPQRNKYAGVGGFAENLVAGLIQQQQNKQAGQQMMDIGRGMGAGFPQNMTTPTNPMALQLLAQMLSRQAMTPMTDLDRRYKESLIESHKSLAAKRTAPKQYDIKTIEQYLYNATSYPKGHEKFGEYREPTKNEIFTLKQMAKSSGYKVRKVTRKDKIKNKKWFLPGFLEGEKEIEVGEWILEKADTGEIIPATSRIEKSPYPEYPGAFLEDGVWKVERDGKKYRIEE